MNDDFEQLFKTWDTIIDHNMKLAEHFEQEDPDVYASRIREHLAVANSYVNAKGMVKMVLLVSKIGEER